MLGDSVYINWDKLQKYHLYYILSFRILLFLHLLPAFNMILLYLLYAIFGLLFVALLPVLDLWIAGTTIAYLYILFNFIIFLFLFTILFGNISNKRAVLFLYLLVMHNNRILIYKGLYSLNYRFLYLWYFILVRRCTFQVVLHLIDVSELLL